jgi:hypothetical protein
MADVIHRTTLEFRRSVNEPNFPEPAWKWNPDMSAVTGVDRRYWKAPPSWDGVAGPLEMTQPEKDAVDAAEAAALVTANRTLAAADVDDTQQPAGWNIRALIEIFNSRDNYLVNRISELQAALDAMKASSGAADNIRNAIPASWLATSTRPRPDAVQDYKDRITTGEVDT